MVRFPIALICAVSASAAAVSLIGAEGTSAIHFKEKLLVTFAGSRKKPLEHAVESDSPACGRVLAGVVLFIIAGEYGIASVSSSQVRAALYRIALSGGMAAIHRFESG